MTPQNLREYEITVILSPEASEAEVEQSSQGRTEFIEGRGGSVGETDFWGLRRLAYPIRKFQEGNYAVTRFSLDPAGVKELEQNLEASEQVLRHLIIRI